MAESSRPHARAYGSDRYLASHASSWGTRAEEASPGPEVQVEVTGMPALVLKALRDVRGVAKASVLQQQADRVDGSAPEGPAVASGGNTCEELRPAPLESHNLS